MPRRKDIHKILIIGSGPIIIGQACEFDYSGTQACKALKEEGYEVVLVNSNPATIMTDPGMADKTYIEPLTVETIERIIEIEKPDGLLPNLGGQTGLNLSSSLFKSGFLKKHNVEMIGVKADAIERGEDRIIFKETMNKLGIEMPKSSPSHSVEEAEAIEKDMGYPVVLRPAYTMGGTGGGIAYNVEELRTIVTRGLAASLVHQVLVEESVLGWEELELEVVRDIKDQKITVCFIENIDPMGVHTGDSFCSAPMLTVPEELQKRMQDLSYKIVDAIGVVGGTNVQFAHDPETDRLVVIEINPRTSRSSALASKATGFPIAWISTKLAAGLTMDEIPYWKEGTLEKYKPSGDYVVIKFARWAFEKFPQAKDILATQMKAVGEVMSIGKTFKESFQKAIRSLEIKRYGLGGAKNFKTLSLDELKRRLAQPSSERIFLIYEALRQGVSVEEMHQMTKIGCWFINEMKELVDFEEEIIKPIKPNYKCYVFRAPNWSMHPTKKISTALLDNGIYIDSSVYKYGKQKGWVNYDYTTANNEMFPYKASMKDICKFDPNSKLIEFPIHCELKPLTSFISLIRIFRALRALNHKHANNNHRNSGQIKIKTKRNDFLNSCFRVLFTKHPRKFDFNQLTAHQMINTLKKVDINSQEFNYITLIV